jgi:phosphocarrier protein
MDLDDECPEADFPPDVITRKLVIQNRKGLHARATAKFVQMVERFEAEVWVASCGEVVGGRSIMALLTLGAGIGSTITVAAKGPDAEAALSSIAALVDDKFGEGE